MVTDVRYAYVKGKPNQGEASGLTKRWGDRPVGNKQNSDSVFRFVGCYTKMKHTDYLKRARKPN